MVYHLKVHPANGILEAVSVSLRSCQALIKFFCGLQICSLFFVIVGNLNGLPKLLGLPLECKSRDPYQAVSTFCACVCYDIRVVY